MKQRIAIALWLGGSLAGCSLAPSYKTPESVPPAASYREIGEWKPAQPADTASRGNWWQVYQNARLDELEQKVDTTNQDLKAAFARLQQARAQTRIARAGYFPTITANSYGTRTRTAQNSPRFPQSYEPVTNDFDLEADLSYQLDLFGRVRSTVNSALATQQASAADLATLSLTLHAELATDYFSLQSADAQQLLLDQTVDAYTKALRLTRNLYEGGAAAQADVAEAQAQLETARTQAADVGLQRAQLEHSIAILVGENPSTFHVAADPLTPDAAPPPVDPGLPSALLERRPDIAAAERHVAAANAQIGIARAAYFPQFSLLGAAGYNSVQASALFNAPSRLWSLGASGALTLFDAGAHWAETAQARGFYEEQLADYRKAVLTAYGEVEDNLIALRQLEQESISEAAAVVATGKALQQAQHLYAAGAATYLNVVVTENAALQAQLSASAIQLRRLSASVALVKALGGGWQSGKPASIAGSH
ncbi:MAG: efflux transporter outer membrane subunit [Steroidobacterales bacterium]